MIVLYCLIYWLIGLAIIWYKSYKSPKEEEPAWILIYAFGPFIWPAIAINDIIGLIKTINKSYLDIKE